MWQSLENVRHEINEVFKVDHLRCEERNKRCICLSCPLICEHGTLRTGEIEILPFHLAIHRPYPPEFFLIKKKIRRIDPSRSKYPIDYTWITLLQGRGKCLRFQDPLGSIYLQCVSFSLARSVNTRKRVTFKRLSVWRLKQQQNNWFTKKYCLPSNHKMISALRNQRRVSRFGTI